MRAFVGPGGGMLNPGLAYGGDWNPEQWDESLLAHDIDLMKCAGVTVVTVGVFSWSVLEPEPGRYRFQWLRRVLDALHDARIGVDLATGTASPPPWLGARFPSTLPVTADGVTLSWGSRQQYNPSSAVYREHAAALVTRLADEFATHPALVAWHVGNEYGCHVWESFDEESAERFRVWCKHRYGTLEALNDAWGSTFWSQRMSTWTEVIPPRAAPTLRNPHQLDDWRRFSSDTLLELYLLERDILRAANPAVPITTNFMGLFPHIDYWRWSPHLDFISNDSYPDPANPRAAREFALECDLMRSLGGGRPFVQMEQVTSAVQWRARNAAKRPGQYELWSVMAVALGADGILNFQWRQSVAGAETFHGGMVPHAGLESRIWSEVVTLGETLGELAAVRDTRVPADVAIVWDWENAWAYHHAVGPTDEDAPEDGARSWHASLFELGHGVDFVHPDQDLTGYRLVVVPSMFRLTTRHATRLEEAARAGTHVVVTYLTGYVDGRGHAVPGGYAARLAGLLGVRVVDQSPRGVEPAVLGPAERLDPAVDRISAAVGVPAAQSRVALWDVAREEAWTGAGRNWVEEVVVDDTDVTVVATFADPDIDGPAITVRRSAGRGAAWYVGTDLDARARRTLLNDVLTEAQVPSAAELPPGIQRLRRGRLTFYLNHSDATVTMEHHPEDRAGAQPERLSVEPRGFRILAPTAATAGATTAGATK